MKQKRAVIVEGDSDWNGGKGFITTTRNTGLSQRETLEETIVNLATLLGFKQIGWKKGARGGTFYKVMDEGTHQAYQSASNCILDLSRLLVKQAKAAHE
ncbi:hypothetical protein [Burkholderia gladioli]|uniref:hypothetical protein n=1 Tax=Burkholderia gladioli TaxID=28095 RepID=UPI001640775C|nr:hypothetical protein [Burkholderia gladioli]